MRYLVLLCLAALVLLNEPSRAVASPGQPGIGDQVACLDASPATAPVELAAVATRPTDASIDVSTTYSSWSDPGVLLHDLYQYGHDTRRQLARPRTSDQSSETLLCDFFRTAEANHLLC